MEASDTVSLLWVIRAGLIGALFGIVGFSRLLLGDRQRYGAILESTPLAALDVVAYNACCYLAVGLPADPDAIATPELLQRPVVVGGLRLVGGTLFLGGVGLLLASVLRRRAIGGQETREGLITTGVYRFSRHPIYLGIVWVAIAIALIGGHVDGLICLPPVMLANVLQARIEERYDVGVRFGEQYARYREATWMFGPPWLWVGLAGSVAGVLALGAWG
jgi:protein-S-isoprenylcysteine O-methyltransferase Ste14